MYKKLKILPVGYTLTKFHDQIYNLQFTIEKIHSEMYSTSHSDTLYDVTT